MAVIADGKLLYPYRTQKISRHTSCTVLRYESPWELHEAAMIFFISFLTVSIFFNSLSFLQF